MLGLLPHLAQQKLYVHSVSSYTQFRHGDGVLISLHLSLGESFLQKLAALIAKEFDSKDAGQMSVYLSAVDDLLRHEGDNPSIGMILCRTKDNVFVEYALRNFNRPIGVAEYETNLVEKLPKELKASLPTVKEIEAELEQDIPSSEIPATVQKKRSRKKSKEK